MTKKVSEMMEIYLSHGKGINNNDDARNKMSQ